MRIIENTIIIDTTPLPGPGALIIPSPEFDALVAAEAERQLGTRGKWDDHEGWENPDGDPLPPQHIDLRNRTVIVRTKKTLVNLDLRGATVVIDIPELNTSGNWGRWPECEDRAFSEKHTIPSIRMKWCLVDAQTTLPEGWKWDHWESAGSTIGNVKTVPWGIAHESLSKVAEPVCRHGAGCKEYSHFLWSFSVDLRDTPSRWVITN